MSGRWDEKENDLERKYDEQHGHNHGDDNGPDDNNNGGWTPRHQTRFLQNIITGKFIQ
jgi:hypothetical protein